MVVPSFLFFSYPNFLHFFTAILFCCQWPLCSHPKPDDSAVGIKQFHYPKVGQGSTERKKKYWKNQINNLHGCFSPSVKFFVHNTSCHTSKCDTSKVMNSGSVTALAFRKIVPILTISISPPSLVKHINSCLRAVLNTWSLHLFHFKIILFKTQLATLHLHFNYSWQVKLREVSFNNIVHFQCTSPCEKPKSTSTRCHG